MNLYQYLQANKLKGLPIELIHKIAVNILISLIFLKECNIIHADLKPENILFSNENKKEVKLIDLGTSCYQNNLIYQYIQSRFYRAPEVAMGIKYTYAIDIWSLGCILCELYNGQPIFESSSNLDLIYAICEYLDIPNQSLIDLSPEKDEFFNENYEMYEIANDDGILRTPNCKNLNDFLKGADPDFINFIKNCLKWNASERLTPIKAMNHKWITKYLDQDNILKIKTKIKNLVKKCHNHFYSISTNVTDMKNNKNKNNTISSINSTNKMPLFVKLNLKTNEKNSTTMNSFVSVNCASNNKDKKDSISFGNMNNAYTESNRKVNKKLLKNIIFENDQDAKDKKQI